MDRNKNQRSEACKKLLEFAAWDGPDIEALAIDSLVRLAERGLPVKWLSPPALQALSGYSWPGGIGELEMVLERAVVLSASETISAEAIVLPGSEDEAEIYRLLVPAAEARASADAEALDPWPTLHQVQREHFWRTFERVGGDESKAARLLGMDREEFRQSLNEFRATATVPFPGPAIPLTERRSQRAA